MSEHDSKPEPGPGQAYSSRDFENSIPRGFVMVPIWMIVDARFSDADIRTVALLTRLASPLREGGRNSIRVTLRELAERMHRSERSVARSLNRLEAIGAIKKEWRGPKHWGVIDLLYDAKGMSGGPILTLAGARNAPNHLDIPF